MNKNRIEYAIDTETGLVISRVNNEVAIPILHYDDMIPKNNFQGKCQLEKMDVINLSRTWGNYKWTRKIPFDIKNGHREFWGMKPLTRKPNNHELTALWEGFKFKHAGKILTVIKVTQDIFGKSDFDNVLVKDNKERYTAWNFNAMRTYLKENPNAVQSDTMVVIA